MKGGENKSGMLEMNENSGHLQLSIVSKKKFPIAGWLELSKNVFSCQIAFDYHYVCFKNNFYVFFCISNLFFSIP